MKPDPQRNPESIRARLNDCSLLIGLLPEQIDKIQARGEILLADDLEKIVEVGSPGDSLFIIIDGRVLIEGERGITIASLSGEDTLHEQYEGDFFGEMSIVDHECRSATVFAVGPTVLFRLSKDALFEIFSGDTELQVVTLMNISRILAHRLRRTNAKFARPMKPSKKG